eukprot:NODE_205_length_14851_cov_0.317584.p1 type:complete len:962 gc:universal NODE_205_length_14851_cov_0.317584:4642-1757(-)
MSKYILGVCAMDSKARSKPMNNILRRLLETFEVVLFGEQLILEEPIQNWPTCDFLISFFSTGFPLDKVINYMELVKPFSVNDLVLQKVLWDRRLVLSILDYQNVKTPKRLVVNRDDGPVVSDQVKSSVLKYSGLDLDSINFRDYHSEHCTMGVAIKQLDYDTISINGRCLTKPFAEKPVDSEDHNLIIYFSLAQGGGARKLFRKIGNKSSEYVADLWEIRSDRAYIYEEFLNANSSVDIKVYTIGKNMSHAETRKSPVVDGIVRRNPDGKELRYVTQLSNEESDMARKISATFGQRICGFDILRVDGDSYVIDVNGWSFVKGSDTYYNKCAAFLKTLFLKAAKRQPHIVKETPWQLKGFITCIRHGDRTPKLKSKFSLRHPLIIAIMGTVKTEVIIKNKVGLEMVVEKCQQALLELQAKAMRLNISINNDINPSLINTSPKHHKNGVSLDGNDPSKIQDEITKLKHMIDVVNRKKELEGTKVQIKAHSVVDNLVVKVQCVVKWGGNFTHANAAHSMELGQSLRNDISVMNKTLLEDVKIYSAAEDRVLQTAKIFAKSFLLKENVDHYITVDRDMLDDSFGGKDIMDKSKKALQAYINDIPSLTINERNIFLQRIQGPALPPVPACLLEKPSSCLDTLRSILFKLRAHMSTNFTLLNVNLIQKNWCCPGDSPLFFKERWERIFKEFDPLKESVDISKISELFDSLIYDALHNRTFFQAIFSDQSNASVISPSCGTPTAAISTPITSNTSFINSPTPMSTILPEQYEDYFKMKMADIMSNNRRSVEIHDRMDSLTSDVSVNNDENESKRLMRTLYRESSRLFAFVAPSEYGLTSEEKFLIGQQVAGPLIHKLVWDIFELVNPHNTDARDVSPSSSTSSLVNLLPVSGGFTRIYVTKESHMHALFNLIYLSGFKMKVPRSSIDELNYLSQISIEVYERNEQHSVKITFSPGATITNLSGINNIT